MSSQNRSLRRYSVAHGPAIPRDTEAIAGSADAYRTASAHFGPRSLPLFYTALERPPDRLVWEIRPAGRPFQVIFGCCKADGEMVVLAAADLPAGETPSWPLANIALTPGGVYAWRVEAEEEGTGNREQGREDPIPNTPPRSGPNAQRLTPGAPHLEGRFWILDAGRMARLRQGRQILAQGPEPEFAPIAQALMLAELGLYQEALRQIQSDREGGVRPSRVLLGHIAQALVYRQMAQQLEQDAGQVPASFGVWARNREAYHRLQAGERSENSAAATSPVAARLLDLF